MKTKQCSKCKETKTVDCFSKAKDKKDGLKYLCKACIAEHYQENKETISEKQRKYREENKGKISEYKRKYKEENPHVVKAYTQRRRARIANAAGTCSAEQLKARWDYYGNKCALCGNPEDLHNDHRIPLARGGTNWPANMRPLCEGCNTSKSTKTETEYNQILETRRQTNDRPT